MKKDNILPIISCIVILSFIFFSIFEAHKNDLQRNKDTYKAWEKYTGNESNLTFSEYYLLKRGRLLNYHHKVKNGKH